MDEPSTAHGPTPSAEDPDASGRRRRRRARQRRTLVLALVLVVAVVATGVAISATTASRSTKPSRTDTERRIPTAPAHGGAGTFLGPDGVESPAVIAENRHPGTAAWRITAGGGVGSIEGFSNPDYAAVGQHIVLYVSSTAPEFNVTAYRMGWYGGLGGRAVWSSAETPGLVQPPCPLTVATNTVSCDNWSASLTVPITSAFVPGDYLLKLVGTEGQQAYVPLTVWDPNSHSAYLIMNRTFTEEGWNTFGGYSFYQGVGPCPKGAPSYPVCNRARVVSLDRPFASGDGASDFLDNEYPLVAFAEERGLDVSYATDLTVDEHPAVLLQHRALISLDHDEAWTYAEREAAVQAQAAGVNIAFLGAAALVRHVRMQPSPLGPDREEVDYRDSSEDPLNGVGDPMQVTGNTWAASPTDWPTSSFVGEEYSGFLEPGKTAPFVVADASAWIFKGTNLHDGSAMAGLIASDFDHLAPSGEGPADLEVLGHSPIALAGTVTGFGSWAGETYSDMTYYTDPTSEAGVFDAGDNVWTNDLRPCSVPATDCYAQTVETMTGNLLWLFGQGPAGDLIPSVPNWRTITPAGS